jgi:hypothetical protein
MENWEPLTFSVVIFFGGFIKALIILARCVVSWPCSPGKDIVLRFTIEHSSLRDFGHLVIGPFLYEDFWKMMFWLVLKLEIIIELQDNS